MQSLPIFFPLLPRGVEGVGRDEARGYRAVGAGRGAGSERGEGVRRGSLDVRRGQRSLRGAWEESTMLGSLAAGKRSLQEPASRLLSGVVVLMSRTRSSQTSEL